MDQTIYLTLQNGQSFAGKSFGAVADVTGELVFTTGMVGYLETLTDPGYYGQLVLQTFPQIGNYGVIPADVEGSTPHLKAYIVKEWCQEPSNFRSEGDLDAFLKAHDIPGLWGVDTRAITRILREEGTMNARISSHPLSADEVAALAAYRVTGAVAAVASAPRAEFAAPAARRTVAVWNFGGAASVVPELTARGCNVVVLPHSATAAELGALAPAGVLLSDGPGDPAENTAVLAQLAELCGSSIPTFAIGLGHQLLALARGGKTEKMKHGHHGANQPARLAGSKRVCITAQNHNYAVTALPQNAEALFVNGNDGTNEGLRYTDLPAFSVQFHPENSGGPEDANFLFDQFIELMDKHTRA